MGPALVLRLVTLVTSSSNLSILTVVKVFMPVDFVISTRAPKCCSGEATFEVRIVIRSKHVARYFLDLV